MSGNHGAQRQDKGGVVRGQLERRPPRSFRVTESPGDHAELREVVPRGEVVGIDFDRAGQRGDAGRHVAGCGARHAEVCCGHAVLWVQR